MKTSCASGHPSDARGERRLRARGRKREKIVWTVNCLQQSRTLLAKRNSAREEREQSKERRSRSEELGALKHNNTTADYKHATQAPPKPRPKPSKCSPRRADNVEALRTKLIRLSSANSNDQNDVIIARR